MATNVSTINHTGEDYATIALWEADTDNDLVTAGDIEVLEIHADDGAISQGAITFAGATTDSSHYRVLRAASGDEWGGDLTPTGVATIAVTATNALKLNEDYFRVEDIFFDTPTSNSRFPVQINNDNCLVRNCFFDDGSGVNCAGDNNNITRCVMLNSEDTVDLTGSGNTLSNCTCYGGTYGVYVTAANTTVYNNISDNHSYHDSYLDGSGSWHSNSAGNMSGGVDFGGPMPGLDDVGLTANTSPGAGNWMIVENVTSGSEDFQLVDDTDNDALGYGTTLTALESTDAFGNDANTDWDVGAFNLAGSSTTYTKTVTVNGIVEEQDKTKTASVNGLVEEQDKTTTATAGGLLSQVDSTVTADVNGLLSLTLLTTCSSDGILKALDKTLTASVSGELEAASSEFTLTTSAGGVLQLQDKTLTAATNGLLKALDKTLTASVSGELEAASSEFTVTASAGGLLQALDKTVTASAGGVLYDTETAVYTATVRGALNTSTGTQQITTANMGGTPEAALSITTYATSNDTAADHGQLCIGFTDGTLSRSVQFCSRHDQSSTDTTRGMTSDFIRLNNAGLYTPDIEAAFSSWVSDGVEINISNAPTSAYLTQLALFGGSNVEALVGSVTTGQPNTEQNINTVGFEPDIVFFIACDRNLDQEVDDNLGCFGVAHNGAVVTQRSIQWEDNEGDASTQIRGQYQTNYAAGQVGDYQIEVGNFDADGFSIWTRDAGARDVAYLALRIPDKITSVTDLLTSPITGDQELDLDIAPEFALAGVSFNASTNTIDTTGGGMPVGVWMADGSDEYCTTMRSEDAADPTNADSFSSDSITVPNHDGSTGFEGSLASFDGDGLTINWSTVDATPRYWFLLTIGDDAATSQTVLASASGILVNHNTLSASVNAFCESQNLTETASVDAVLQTTLTATASVSGHLVALGQLQVSANGLMQDSLTQTCDVNGWLFLAAGSIVIPVDAILFNPTTVTASAEGYLFKGLTSQADAMLKKTDRSVTCTVDGFILGKPGDWDTIAHPSLPDWDILQTER